MAQRFGEYEAIETIYTSQKTIAYLAQKKNSDKLFIIKCPFASPPASEDMARLLYESHLLKKLESEYTPKVVDIQNFDDTTLLILEKLEGSSLTQLIQQKIKNSLEKIYAIALCSAKALSWIHAKGIIHKDITPNNIIVNEALNHVYIIDFDIASEAEKEAKSSTIHKKLEGSLPYISPEQTGRMNRDIDHRSDLYSLGVTFFEMTTGHTPFLASDPLGWIHCHVSQEPLSILEINNEIPVSLARIIHKLMAKDVEQRYQSTFGLIRDLEKSYDLWKKQLHDQDFVAGTCDVSELFIIPQKLYGRDIPLSSLTHDLDQARKGESRVAFVTGTSGIGKSSLINEMERIIVQQQGRYVAGKFEQIERCRPYSSFIQALNMLINDVYKESETTLKDIKSKIVSAIGQNGKILTDLIPNLQDFIGEQPEIAQMNALEAENRFLHVISQFIRVFAVKDHPLVIFIDDLQWADSASLKLIEHMTLVQQIPYLLLIGSYRSNEVVTGDNLSNLLEKLQQSKIVSNIELEPLDTRCIQKILADTLHVENDDLVRLAEILSSKTKGNPFFINEFIKKLYQEKLLWFHHETGTWRWDNDKIATLEVSDDLARFMVDQLLLLPDETQKVLAYCSCIGHTFSLDRVTRLTGKESDVIAMLLERPLQLGLISTSGEAYQLAKQKSASFKNTVDATFWFQHDRIQFAAGSLIDEEEKSRIHLAIGRALVAGIDSSHLSESLTLVTGHLNKGRVLMTSSEERIQLAKFNLKVALKAKASIAYEAAYDHLSIAKELLGDDAFSSHYDLAYQIYFELTEVALILRKMDESESYRETCFSKAKEWQQKVKLNLMLLIQYSNLKQIPKAISFGLKGLSELGYQLNEKPSMLRLITELLRVRKFLKDKKVENFINLPFASDPKLLYAVSLLAELGPTAYVVGNENLYGFVTILTTRLILENGLTPEASQSFALYGAMSAAVLGQFESGQKFCQLAREIEKRYPNPKTKSKMLMVCGAFINWIDTDWAELPNLFKMSVEAGLESGDFFATAYSCYHYPNWVRGKSLDHLTEEYSKAVQTIQRTGNREALLSTMFFYNLHQNLQHGEETGRSLLSFGEYDEKSMYQEAVEKGYVLTQAEYLNLMVKVCFISERYHEGLKYLREIDNKIKNLLGMPATLLYYFYGALTLAAVYHQLPYTQKIKAKRRIKTSFLKLRELAKHQHKNFSHLEYLVLAELYRINGHHQKAVKIYEKAITQAKINNSFFHRALACEVAARYHANNSETMITSLYISKAIQFYSRWGAGYLVKKLEKNYKHLIQVMNTEHQEDGPAQTSRTQTYTTTAIVENIDMTSILKATQAISEEMQLASLTRKMMSLVAENAGAEWGCLILKGENDEFQVKGYYSLAHPESEGPLGPMDDKLIAAEIVRYCARSKSSIVLHHAAQEGQFTNDPYIVANKTKSVMASPIVRQGELMGVIYLENNKTTHTFTPDRLQILQILAAQAAISIANARTYARIEAIVEEKTADIRSILTNIRQGIFTIAHDQTIAADYSVHLEELLETPHIRNRNMVNLLFGNSDLADDKKSMIRSIIELSIGQDDSTYSLNCAHLPREFIKQFPDERQKILEIDFCPVLDESGIIQKFLVTLRDVTLLRKLESESKEHKDALAIIQEIVETPAAKFLKNHDTLIHYINEVENALTDTAAIDEDGKATMLRNLHTAKGLARTFKLTGIAAQIHQSEQIFVNFSAENESSTDRSLFLNEVRVLTRLLERYKDINDNKLGRKQQSLPEESSATVCSIKDYLHTHTLSYILEDLRASVQDMTRQLHKPMAHIAIKDPGFYLESDIHTALRDAFMHIIRNSIDHGIEMEEERIKAQKQPHGTITFELISRGEELVIKCYDDGRGLNLAALKAKAAQIGQLTSNTDLSLQETADLVFRSGLSTAEKVSDISGRGIGMDAVKAFLKERGIAINIHPASNGKGQDFVDFYFEISIPKKFYFHRAA
jgi:predicted ATPase/GAF domain-containing protein/predicted Ser/Thr protein kinase